MEVDQQRKDAEQRARARAKVEGKGKVETKDAAVRKGVYGAFSGRWGEVLADPDSDEEVKLRWLDDGEESEEVKASRLSPVVVSLSDLVLGTRIPVNDPDITEFRVDGQEKG